jgi:hypothetical protein
MGRSNMRFFRHGMAGQMNGSDSAPESHDETSVTSVGDVLPRRGMLQRAIHEKTVE